MAKILVADDEYALLENFCEIVTGLGHDCVRAHDGEEGLRLAREVHPDLVICDYMMPRKNGVELARALKADPDLARVPVILLSAGRPTPLDRHEIALFLPKPVSVDRFEEAIRNALVAADSQSARTAGPPSAPVALGRDEMLSWMSHEIKSPLSAAVAATQLALRDLRVGADPSSIEKRLKSISRQHVRITELVNSLLDAAALHEGRLELAPELMDLRGVVDECVRSWQELHPEVRFEVDAGAPSVDVHADRERVRQILDNLVSNAVKYGRPANEVHIVVRGEGGTARVSVADRGSGIAPDQQARIFDRFHRVAGQGGHGHGLGLYIARSLARLHGGDLAVESELGRGATFTVTLPV